ncbi:MAG: O-antigen ligase family protein [Treponematales bacterium]
MKTKTSAAKLYLFVVFFTPSFIGYIGLNSGQLLYLLVYFVVSGCLAIRYIQRRVVNANAVLLLSLLLFLHYTASTVLNFDVLIIRDFIEIFRPLIYYLSFLLSLMILTPFVMKHGGRKCLDYMDNLVFCFSFIEFLKFIRPMEKLFWAYLPVPFGHINYVRFSGVTGFSYSYAWLLIVCIIYNAVKTNGKISVRVFYYSFLLLLTGSRSGMATLFVVYCCLFILFKKIRIRLLALLGAAAFLVWLLYTLEVPIVVTSVDYILRLIQAFLGKTDDGSLSTRQGQVYIALERFNESPLYGTASNKSQDKTIENFYFHHLAAWGIVGLLCYLLWLCSFRLYVSGKQEKTIFALVILMSLVISFSTPIFDQVRIFNIFYALVAALIISAYKRKEHAARF